MALSISILISGLAVASLAAQSKDVTKQGLEARFIANAGVELSDGATTLLIDFPYQSGYSVYMDYPDAELDARREALCLFTHRHGDHFAPDLVERIGCRVAGPLEVQAMVPAPVRAGAGPVWRWGGAEISCLTTPHADLEHCSYSIEWAGLRIGVSGDIEELAALGVLDGFDALLIASWLLPQAHGDDPAGPTIVVVHHTADEVVAGCRRCLVPRRDETFRLVPRELPRVQR